MKDSTFNFIRTIIRNGLNEEGMVSATPTNCASSGQISGLSGKENDLPPVDLRKRKFKKLPDQYKELFRKKKNV
jgi:hypothetical protein